MTTIEAVGIILDSNLSDSEKVRWAKLIIKVGITPRVKYGVEKISDGYPEDGTLVLSKAESE